PGHSNAHIVEPVTRGALEPEGDTQQPRIREPGAAAQNAVAAGSRDPGRAVARRTAIALVIMIAVLRPLPDVAERVIEAEGVGGEAPDRRRHGIAVAAGQERPRACSASADVQLGGLIEPVAVDADRFLLVAEAVARTAAGCLHCPRGIFPFGFREQAVAPARFLPNPIPVGLGVVPVQAGRRMRPLL